jgi:acyl carrier protein
MKVLELIYDAIDEVNLDLNEGDKISKNEDTLIFGNGSNLDSLGLVNLITIIEQKLEEETGDFISIADERAMSMESSPFRSVKSLKQYVEELVNEN